MKGLGQALTTNSFHNENELTSFCAGTGSEISGDLKLFDASILQDTGSLNKYGHLT